MPERFIDKQTYERLVDAFRVHGPNFKRVAQECDVSRVTARRALRQGWPHKWDWARPIVTVLAEESFERRAAMHEDIQPELDEERASRKAAQAKARAEAAAVKKEAAAQRAAERAAKKLRADLKKADAKAEADRRRAEAKDDAARQEALIEQARAERATLDRERELLARRRSEAESAQEAEREKARQQALEARQQEAQLVRLARGAAIGTLGGAMRLMPALAKLADQLRAAVDNNQIPTEKAGPTINTIARTVREATVAAQVVIELERLHVGAPQAIIGVMQHEVALDEAALAVEEFQAAIDRSRQLGIVQPTTISVGPRKETV